MLLRRRQQKLQIESWKNTRKRNQKGDNVTKESRKREKMKQQRIKQTYMVPSKKRRRKK